MAGGYIYIYIYIYRGRPSGFRDIAPSTQLSKLKHTWVLQQCRHILSGVLGVWLLLGTRMWISAWPAPADPEDMNRLFLFLGLGFRMVWGVRV